MTEVQKKVSEIPEESRYSGRIPETELKELPEEVVEQYALWDMIVKKEISLYPELLLPLIREVFHREYPAGTRIEQVSTEYVVRKLHGEGGSTLGSIRADTTVRVGGRDIYHLECQMNREKGMVLRMLEYDVHVALVHGRSLHGEGEIPEVMFPKSVILYLYPYRELPAEEKCILRFADDTVHEFRVPVVAVQGYSPSMVAEKHLDMLIPFLPIRFKPRLGRKDKLSLKKDLTEFVGQCMMIIEREKKNGTLTNAAGKDMTELLSIACAHLLKKEPELDREVQEMILPEIHLLGDDIRELEARKERLEAENGKLEAENGKLEAENEKLRQLEPQIHLLGDDIRELEARKERLEAEKGKLEAEKGKLEAENEKLRQLEPQIHLLGDDIRALEAELQEEKDKSGQLETKNEELINENEQLKLRIRELEEASRE